MLAYDVDTLDNGAVPVNDHLEHLAGLTLVVTGIYLHGIAFFDVNLFHFPIVFLEDLRCQ